MVPQTSTVSLESLAIGDSLLRCAEVMDSTVDK